MRNSDNGTGGGKTVQNASKVDLYRFLYRFFAKKVHKNRRKCTVKTLILCVKTPSKSPVGKTWTGRDLNPLRRYAWLSWESLRYAYLIACEEGAACSNPAPSTTLRPGGLLQQRNENDRSAKAPPIPTEPSSIVFIYLKWIKPPRYMAQSTTTTATTSETKRGRTVSTTMSDEQVAMLNSRLRLYGFETVGQMLSAFRDGRFPPVFDSATADKINIQAGGQVTIIPDFAKNIKDEDFKKFLIEERRVSPEYAGDLVSYFRRFYDQFFGAHPEELNRLTPHKRSWMLLSMRNFGLYYLRLTGSDDAKHTVRRITDRFSLNKGLDMGHNILIVEDEFVQKSITALLELKGAAGFYTTLALLSNLREDELVYIHDKPICEKKPCKCNNLHVFNKKNGLSVIIINWIRPPKNCYFTVLPTKMWEHFRATTNFGMGILDAIKPIVKASTPINFHSIRKISYNVLARTFDKDTADVFAGRVKSVSAEHYAMYELDRLATGFEDAWEKFGVDVNDDRLYERW